MPGILPEDVKRSVQDKLAKALKDPVNLTFFTMELECQYCQQTHQLLDEIAGLSDSIALKVYRFDTDKDQVASFGIERIPATVISAEKDRGIRMYGIPAGYEFTTLIENLILCSTGEHALTKESVEKLERVKIPVHIQVFVTNACPYCAPTVHLAHKLAYVSDNVRADGINATEFIPLAQKYNVSSVPKVVINEKIEFIGALPEESFVDQVISATRISDGKEKK
jgi:glutaredoxin-like protein